RDEYRRLYVAANGEVLGLKQEIRHLKDRLANRETENLRQTTMERERMNIQLQKDASSRELESLMTNSFQQLIQNKKKGGSPKRQFGYPSQEICCKTPNGELKPTAAKTDCQDLKSNDKQKIQQDEIIQLVKADSRYLELFSDNKIQIYGGSARYILTQPKAGIKFKPDLSVHSGNDFIIDKVYYDLVVEDRFQEALDTPAKVAELTTQLKENIAEQITDDINEKIEEI
ncbi:819_t:CDS:2, partial [Racocetra fulgida]